MFMDAELVLLQPQAVSSCLHAGGVTPFVVCLKFCIQSRHAGFVALGNAPQCLPRHCFVMFLAGSSGYSLTYFFFKSTILIPATYFYSSCHVSSYSSRPAASSTSSASYPESRAAYTTSVNCVARGCGTAVTSPLWSVLVNIQTRRAAPMEAPPPPSPPHPPRHPHPRPHQTPPPRLHRWARKAPKPGIFSPSGNSPEVEAVGSFAGLGSC